MQRPCLLDTDTARKLTDSKCFTDAAVLTFYDSTFEDLDTLAVSFLDLRMYMDCVTDFECVNGRF